MNAKIETPRGVDIVPRHMGFSFGGSKQHSWFEDDPWSTQLFNALSLTFPSGEQMFIDSVRHFRNRISEPELQRAVKAFISQEAQHRREHEQFNGWLASAGLPVDEIYAWLEKMIEMDEARLPPKARLAVTCALEHFTAIMANAFLTEPDILESMDEQMRMLWIWHAIEETEHKAVAFDVYEAVGGTYQMRRHVMVLVTLNFLFNTTRIHQRLLRVSGEQWNLASASHYLKRFWGRRGAFTKLIPAYLDYSKRDFHPWQQDNRAAVERYKALVEASAKRIMPLEPVA